MNNYIRTIVILTLLLNFCACSSSDNKEINIDNNNEIIVDKYDDLIDKEIDEQAVVEENNSLLPSDDEESIDEIEELSENPFNKVDSILNYSSETDYFHAIGSDYIFLGTGENAKIAVTAKPAGLEVGDILFFDSNETLLNIEYGEAVSDYDKNTTKFTVYITGNQGPETQTTGLIYASGYDIYENENETIFYAINVTIYNETDGKIVYVTEEGEKYHYSKECINGADKATTLKEALAYEYEPCKKCVK